MAEWDEWMKWEGPAPMTGNSSSGRRFSSRGCSSISSHWLPSPVTEADIDSNFDQMVTVDAPFEFDDSTTVPDPEMELSSLDSPLKPEQRRQYCGYSSLTIDEERELQEIAMPYYKDLFTRKDFITSISTECESAYSPQSETQTRSKKRKSSTKDTSDAEVGDRCLSRKRGHNVIEKRYRANLNEKIVLLQQSVPCLRVVTKGDVLDEEASDKEGMAEKYGKAVILTHAVEYITHLEDCIKRLGKDTNALRARVVAFEKLAMLGSIQIGGVPSSVKVKTLESMKLDFQQTTFVKTEKIKAGIKAGPKTKQKNSKKISF